VYPAVFGVDLSTSLYLSVFVLPLFFVCSLYSVQCVLADHTYGRACATGLCPSVCLSVQNAL